MAKNIDIEIAGGMPQRLTLSATTSEAAHQIGSACSCAIHVTGASVSDIHAELFHDGEHWCIRDRAGMNGTFIDGNRLFISAIRLEIGQRVRLGFGEGAATFSIIAGAAEEQDGVDVVHEVKGFLNEQKRERKKLPAKWKVAIPSIGILAISLVWGSGMAVVAHRRAALAADPHLAEREQAISDASTSRLVAIMSGEARPEDVDVAQIVKDASFGRTSFIADAMVGTLNGGDKTTMTQRLVTRIQEEIEPVRSVASGTPAPVASKKAVEELTTSHGSVASASTPLAPIVVDEKSLSHLIVAQKTIDAEKREELNHAIVDQSRVVTLRRLRGMLEERHRLQGLIATESADSADAAHLHELEKRLTNLGIDTAKLHWQPGSDCDQLASQLDPAILEGVRKRLLAALAQQ